MENERVMIRIMGQTRSVRVLEVRPRPDGQENLLVYDEASHWRFVVKHGEYEFIGVTAVNYADFLFKQAQLGDVTQNFQEPWKYKAPKVKFLESAEEKRRKRLLDTEGTSPALAGLSKEELLDLLTTLQEMTEDEND